MKKTSLLLCASAMLCLASCGGSNTASSAVGNSSNGGDTSSNGGASSNGGSTTKTDVLVWCAEAATNLTQTQINAYLTEAGLTESVNITVNAVGEGAAASNMITDVDSGADIYFFAQDQLARLVTAGALSQIAGVYKTNVEAENGAGSVAAATVGDKLYAFPATNDNGYYVYYNSDMLSAEQVGSWESIKEACKANNYTFEFNYGDAWYNFGFFYGAGADCVFETNDEGAYVRVTDTYNTEAGVEAGLAMNRIFSDASVAIKNSSASDTTDRTALLVSGTWDYDAMKTKWGDKLRCVELPTFENSAGTKIHTGSFAGMKLVGVKPQTDTNKAKLVRDIAQYLTGEIGQQQRFDTLGWGPSNITVANSDAVKAAPQIAALAAQSTYSKPQGQFPNDWWALGNGLGTDLVTNGTLAREDVVDLLDAHHASVLALVED